MKTRVLLIIFSVIFFSCKKNKPADPTPDEKKHKVDFNVSGFTQQIIEPAALKQTNALATNETNPLTSAISGLYYYAYNSAGKLVSMVKQESTAANFGSISDYLVAGDYTIVFVGGQTDVVFNGTDNFTNAKIAGYTGGVYNNNTFRDLPWKDTFFKKITLTVTTAGAVTQNVSLQRVVGMLSFKLEDNLPATASKIEMKVVNDYADYYFQSQPAVRNQAPAITVFSIPAAAIGQPNFSRSVVVCNTATPFTVTLTCYDAANKLLAQRVITNVTVQNNTQTLLTGKLFSTDSPFDFTLNKDWDTTPINIPF